MRPLVFALKNVAFAFYLIVLLTAFFLLLAPPDLLAQLPLGLGFTPYLDRKLLEVALAGCVAVHVIYIALTIGDFARRTMHDRQLRESLRKTLLDLSGEEKRLLRQFIRDRKTSIYAPLSDQTAKELQEKAIIYRTSALLAPGAHFQYSLEPRIRELLNERPLLIAAKVLPLDSEGVHSRRSGAIRSTDVFSPPTATITADEGIAEAQIPLATA
jgi:hypothetical protein